MGDDVVSKPSVEMVKQRSTAVDVADGGTSASQRSYSG